MSTKEERAKTILGRNVYGGDPFVSDPHPMHQETAERVGLLGGTALIVDSRGLLRAIEAALPDGDLFTENALLKSALMSISSFVAFELNEHQQAVKAADEKGEDNDFSDGASAAAGIIRRRMIEELQHRGLSVEELTVFMDVRRQRELPVETAQPLKVRPPAL